MVKRQSTWLPQRSNTQFEKILKGEGGYSIVFWDLECTSLSGMIGRILCCSFKPLGKPVYTFAGDKKPYISPLVSNDSKLAIAIRDELEKYDIIVGHNSKLFDARFLEARLFKAGTRRREPRYHVDSMWTIRSHLRISSKLANVQEFLQLEEKKSPLLWDQWQDAAARNAKAMKEVIEHCERDVKVLELAYKKLIPYVGELKLG